MAPAPGTLVDGRYRLVRQLGTGGMGTVWAGEHVLTGRAVALKFVRHEVRIQREASARLEREARAATQLSHPNVVEVLDMFELPGQGPVLVMSLLEGETLGQRLLASGVLELEETARLMLPVISALGAAHAKGIVHRDLKPENIFIAVGADGNEIVKVLDFGIAKFESVTDQRLTESGTVLGTPAYMSPEQATGDPGVDCRSDVWALGVILHQCLSGRRPVEGRNIGEQVKLLYTRGIDSIRTLEPRVPADVAALIDRMLAKHRDHRLSDLRHAHDVLARYASLGVPSFGPPSANVLLGVLPSVSEPARATLISRASSELAPTLITKAPITEAAPQSAPPIQRSGIFSPNVEQGPKVKGVAFRSSIECFKRLRGALAAEVALREMPSELAGMLERGLVLHSGWYPIDWYSGMFGAMRRATGEGREMLTELGATSIESDFRGVYRALLRLISPEQLFRRSASIFSRYFSEGRFEVLESRAGVAQGRWSSCRGFNADVWAEVFGSARRMLELAGARGVVVNVVSGGGDGEDWMEVSGTWAGERFGAQRSS